jgi:hypothetical protein
MVGMPAVFMRIDSARPRRYNSHLEFVEAVEAKTCRFLVNLARKGIFSLRFLEWITNV